MRLTGGMLFKIGLNKIGKSSIGLSFSFCASVAVIPINPVEDKIILEMI